MSETSNFTKEEKRILDDVFDNKDLYISMVKKAEDKKAIIEAYENLTIWHRAYVLSLIGEVNATSSYQASRTKLDPYAAGGIASSIGGVGAGVYTANKVAQENQGIEPTLISGAKAYASSCGRKRAQDDLMDEVYALIQKLEKYPAIKKARLDTVERIYQRAMAIYSRRKKWIVPPSTIDEFMSIASYKDSAKIASLIKKRNWRIVNVLPAVSAPIIGLVASIILCADMTGKDVVGAYFAAFLLFGGMSWLIIFCLLGKLAIINE